MKLPENGLQYLDLGSGGYVQKLRRGADIIPLWSLLLKAPCGLNETRAHNEELARAWTESFGDMQPDLASLLEMEKP